MQTILPQHPKDAHQEVANSLYPHLLVSPTVLKSVMHIFHHGLFPVYVPSWVPKEEALRLGAISCTFQLFE